MLLGIGDLRRFTIAAREGPLGSVSDVYFDDRGWSVRYLVVDAGNRRPGRRVLVSPFAVRRSSEPATLRVALSEQQLAACPDVDSRGLPGSSTQQHLHTATAVVGYTILTEDGEIGHVKDVLVDDQAWAIRYLAVDAKNRWAGKNVLVSPAWLTLVTWDASKTLYCIATAVDNTIASKRPAIRPIEYRQTAAFDPRLANYFPV